MYESKIGKEKETDLTQIKAPPKPKKLEQRPRIEEKVIMTRKKVVYLDNFQYKKTKEFLKIENGSKVVHQRLSGPFGGSYEEISIQRFTTSSGNDNNKTGKKITNTTTKTEQSARSISRGNANINAENRKISASEQKKEFQLRKWEEEEVLWSHFDYYGNYR